MKETRIAAVDMNAAEFKIAGHQLVDRIAGFIDGIRERPVTTGISADRLKQITGSAPLPEAGLAAPDLLNRAADLLIKYSLFNGHPKFFGYITSSAAPIGALADLLAAAINPNAGAYVLSPVATIIEKQVVKWLAALIDVPAFDGLLVSGGNMANYTAFLAGIHTKAPGNTKQDGIGQTNKKLLVYCSASTHTWIEKAAILSGLGSNAIRWIATDDTGGMNIAILENKIREDIKNGHYPLMIIGTAGDVSTGAVDDLAAIGAVAKTHGLWFHIDGAYGMPAAVVPELKILFEGIEEADSIALDPHKWLYCPLEAACTLVKEPNHLLQTYSSHPVYYNFGNEDEPAARNFYEYGIQNSRGFRALKVWLALQQAGKNGYIEMIRTDVQLSKLLFDLAEKHPDLEAVTQHLSITTLRYVPNEYRTNTAADQTFLDKVNETLVNELQRGGELFLSNALVRQRYCLRLCIVNFRTSKKDIEETIVIIVKEGRRIYERLKNEMEKHTPPADKENHVVPKGKDKK